MKLYHDTFATPLGSFSAAIDDAGAVVASVFGDAGVLRQRLRGAVSGRDRERLGEVGDQVRRYFGGTLRGFTLDLAPQGTPFQQRVWSLLRGIPFGETRAYRDLARALGRPGASRAVGGANGANPVCLFLPCHRVIAADGSASGYAFGAAVKQGLLAHEGVRPFDAA